MSFIMNKEIIFIYFLVYVEKMNNFIDFYSHAKAFEI